VVEEEVAWWGVGTVGEAVFDSVEAGVGRGVAVASSDVGVARDDADDAVLVSARWR
jgi:hypothetical protein